MNGYVLPTEKTKNPEQIDVYTVQQKGVRKRVVKTTLGAFWKKDSVIRINNVDDKQETPNSEKDIRAKVTITKNFLESTFPIPIFTKNTFAFAKYFPTSV